MIKAKQAATVVFVTNQKNQSVIANSAKYRRRVLWLAAAMAGVTGFASRVNAQSLTWDPSLTGTSGSDGAGSWSDISASGTAIFSNGSADVAWNNATPTVAVFGAGGSGTYNVSIGSPIVATGLTFNAGANYNLSGSLNNAFNIGGGTINFSTNVSLASFNLSGAGGITFNGTSGSVLTLSGSGASQDSFTGPVTLLGGTLNVNYSGVGDATPFSGPQTFNVSAGATIIQAQSYSMGAAGKVFTVNLNGGTFIIVGSDYSGVLNLTGGNVSGGTITPYTGGVTTFASSTTSTISTAIATSSSYENLTTNVALGTAPGGIDLLMTGAISGNAGLSKSGAGVLELTTAESYTGTTTISAGTLMVTGGNNRLTSTTPISLTGGLLVISGVSQQVGSISSSSAANTATAYSIVNNVSTGSILNVGYSTLTAADLYIGGLGGSGAFQNNLALTKSGTGVVQLAGTDTYTGGTTISGGALSFLATSAIVGYQANPTTAASSITVQSGGILAILPGYSVGGFATSDVNNVLASAGFGAGSFFGIDSSNGNVGYVSPLAIPSSAGLATVGPNTFYLGGTQTYTGGTAVKTGTLEPAGTASLPGYTTSGSITVSSGATLALPVGNAGQFGSSDIGNVVSNVSFASGSALGIDTYSNASGFTYAGNITGTGVGLTKLGANTLTLSGSSGYSGPTLIKGGTLALGTAGSINSTSALNLSGGSISIPSGYTLTQSFASTSINAGGSETITNAGTNNLSLGAITRTVGGVVDFGTGPITTTTTNTNGILGGWATQGGGATWAIQTSGGAIGGLGNAAYTLASVAGTTAANYSSGNIDVNTSMTPAALITPNTLRFNVSGSNTVTLTGTNTFTAGSGILVTPSVGANVSNVSGGFIQAVSGKDLVISQYNTAAPLNISSGIIDNATSALTKNGPGILNITGTNSYAGGTFVNGGTLSISGGGIKGPITINSGGTVNVSGFTELGQSGQVPKVTINAGGVFNGTSGQPVSFTTNFILNGGSISGAGGAGVIFSGASYGITTTASNTTATISQQVYGYGTVPLFFNVASGTTTSGIDLNLSATLAQYSGTTSLVKNGPGLMNYSGSGATTYGSIYGGVTTINDGTLEVTGGGSQGGLLSGTPSITVNPGATLLMNGTSADLLGYTFGKEALVINGGTVLNAGQRQTTENPITMTGGTLATSGSGLFEMLPQAGSNFTAFTATSDAYGNPAVVTGAIPLASATNLFNVSQGVMAPPVDMLVSSAITTYSGTPALVKNGNGVLEFTNANTYSGGTTINAGTLQLGNGASGKDGTVSATGGINDNAVLVYDYFANQTYAGGISGTGTILKVGSANLTLSGTAGSYSGIVTVASGKLYENGTLGSSSTVVVNSNATLGGNGIVGGAANISNGGILEAGSGGTGSLTVGNLTFAGTGTINIGTLAGYASNAAINVTGSFNNASAGAIAINVTNLVGAGVGTYELMNFSGGSIYGTNSIAPFTLASLANRTQGYLTNTGSQLDLTVTGTDYLLWTGAVNSQWDTTTMNWATNSSGGVTATQYIDTPGDAVVFGDSVNGTPVTITTVNINTGIVHPGAVTFNNSSTNYTIQSSFGFGIAGSTGITLSGTGNVILNTSNSYTGPVVINAGALYAQNVNALGLTSGITVASGATLKIASGSVIPASATVSLTGTGASGYPGALESLGSNTFGGPLSFGGSTTIVSDSGTLNFSNGTAISISGAGSNGSGFLLTLAGAGNGFIGGALNTGSGALTKTGVGTWTLNGADSFTGLTNVSAGTLIVNGDAGQAHSYTVAQNATLFLGYSSGGGYSGSVTVNGSGINSSAGVYFKGGTTFQVNGGLNLQTAPTTVNSYGTGVATLRGFDVNTGPFILTSSTASGSVLAPTINLNTGGYGFDLSTTSGSNNSTGDLTITGSVVGTGSAAASVSGGFAAGLSKTGNGSLLLTGTSTYTSGTSIGNGSIILAGGNNRLPVTTKVQLGVGTNSGKLILNGVNQTITGLFNGGTGTADAVLAPSVTPSILTINYNTSGGTDTYAGTLGSSTVNQSNLSLVTTGVGTIVLSNSNFYTGGTTVNQGVLTGTTTGSFGTGSLLVNPTGVAGNSSDIATVNTTNSLATTAAVTVNTNSATAIGTLNFNGTNETIGSLAGTGTVVLANPSGTVLTVGGSASTTFSGLLTDNGSNLGSLVKSGTGVLALTGTNNTYGGGTTVNSGALVLGALASAGTGNVTVNGGGVVIQNASSPSLTTISTLVANGYNNGAWNGPGFNSSTAASDTTALTALGVIVNDNGMGSGVALYNTFEGAATVDGDVLVKLTYYGDTDLNGKVDGSDYSRVDASALSEQTGPSVSGWYNGDFNYDGVVNGSDYTLLDNAFNSQGALIASEVATATDQIAGSSGASAVPEPATLGLLGLGAIGLLGRRRRR